MKKMKSGTKKYYDESLKKTGHSKTAIPDWTDQRCYSQKEMKESEDKGDFTKKPDSASNTKKKGY